MNIFGVVEHVEDEYNAAKVAVARLIEEAGKDPTVLQDAGLRPRDLQDCLDRLENTYVLRLFAEFEGSLRRYWKWVRNRDRLPKVRMYHLLRHVASKHTVPADVVENADRVRELRNSIVHLGDAPDAMTFEDCRAVLCRFLGNLDYRWLHKIPYS